MTKFEDSEWAKGEASQAYRESADNYLPERHTLIEITRSLYRHFLAGKETNKVLDLGCGDGRYVHELLKIDDHIEATLVDASPEMLDAAKDRLAGFENVRCVNASFQDLLASDLLKNTFDFVLSSLAIHHLTMDEKETLFEYIYSLLNPGGIFLNIDVVISPTEKIEKWYLRMWREWIEANADESAKDRFLHIPEQYKHNPDNQPDTLSAQLKALEKIGFKNVDCHYKFGIFAVYGGNSEA